MTQQALFSELSSAVTAAAALHIDRRVTPGRLLAVCDGCGFDRFLDAKIHGGRSTRRDCARCKLTMGFPIWYGQAVPLEQRQMQNAKRGTLTTSEAAIQVQKRGQR